MTQSDPNAFSFVEAVRLRARQVFAYLSALQRHRTPVERRIEQHPWHLWLDSLPNHPAVELRRQTVVEEDVPVREDDGTLVRVTRAKTTKAPAPPTVLREWLDDGWDDPQRRTATHRASVNRVTPSGETRIEPFEENAERVASFGSWQKLRDQWATNELPAREALRLFERLYELHGRLERESETIELVLGDGVLSWNLPPDGVFHPVLIQAVQLAFDPDVPEFRVINGDRATELHTALFLAIPQVEGRVLSAAREELDAAGVHALGDEQTSAFLRGLAARVSPKGEFHDAGRPPRNSEEPRVGRAPVLFVRSRNHGFAAALEAAFVRVGETDSFPIAVARIVGIDTEAIPLQGSGPDPAPANHAPAAQDVFFSKPANREQFRIAEQLDRHSCVLVQGPPGTGKSHTIANLIGHLLAHGQSVLVTAHTTKALRVLRQHVVEPLRPLCVSVLDSDLDSRRELESAVAAIVQRLSSANAEQLAREKHELSRQRHGLLSRVQAAQRAVIDARWTEFREVTFQSTRLSPADAARRVAADAERHQWIPGPIAEGVPIPLSDAEFAEVYASNRLSPADEAEASLPLPEMGELPGPEEFARWCEGRRQLAQEPRDTHSDRWSHPATNIAAESLEPIAQELLDAVVPLVEAELWMRVPAQCAFQGDGALKLWLELVEQIDALAGFATEVSSTILDHGPELPQDVEPDELGRTLQEIAQHMEGGGALSSAKLLFNPKWSKLIRAARVNGVAPKQSEHFRALEKLLDLRIQRQRFLVRWDRQVAVLGAPSAAELGPEPEQAARQHAGLVGQAIACAERLRDRLTRLDNLRFDWQGLVAAQRPRLGITGELDRLLEAMQGPIVSALVARANAARWALIEAQFSGLLHRLDAQRQRTGSKQPSVERMTQAARLVDADAYAVAYARLDSLAQAQSVLARRKALLAKLEGHAPAWAAAIRNRAGIHAAATAPEDVRGAWIWRQLRDELARRGEVSLREAETELERAQRELREVTGQLIDRAAWENQARRTSLSQRQALSGWLDTVRRIGKGTGKSAPKLRRKAAQLMKEAADAVPVWVMPLTRVVQNFDARTAAFDVIIVDEASQMDVLGLLAFQMARKVVVVGDHEQVSPAAVGQDQDAVDKLIAEHLQGIPNGHLYDGKQSVYDLARQSFGGVIRLVEHFRCVPDIVNFSNWLSYEGEIQPLREPGNSALQPHVVSHRVPRAFVENKTNRAEAEAVASLVLAAAEQPEYSKKTFGVVSLVGDEQANAIDKLLRDRMSPKEHEDRHVVCGNAAQFQGDERDVMWLSMVDAPAGGPLPLRTQDAFKQRFNVAASRARDQMWIVHSLDPVVDLKSGDLRRRLIDHAMDPKALAERIERGESRTESEFEKQVLRRILAAGYEVRTQWKVGHYRIDMVVIGDSKRLAVECDGDRYHTVDNLQEDLARQATLERLGWRFARIRGTEFFRDPDRAMSRVYDALEELEIPRRAAIATALETPTSELHERVVKRAAQLLAAWRQQ